MRLLANPLFVRMALGLVLFMGAFIVALFLTRALRRKLVDEAMPPEPLGDQTDPTYAYSAVIQKLKQQKFELQSEGALQKRRAKASEQITASVIANLPCGVLLIGPNGLVKQANAAARQLLGFASPLGMSPDELFRETKIVNAGTGAELAADVMKRSLRDRARANAAVSYESAGGELHNLQLTLVPLSLEEASGLACIIADETALGDLKRERLLSSEISAEMALELRTSLSIIQDCARRIGSAADPNAAAPLADDIVHQAERLEKIVGSFLAGDPADRALAARA